MDKGVVAEQGRFKDLSRYKGMKIEEDEGENPMIAK